MIEIGTTDGIGLIRRAAIVLANTAGQLSRGLTRSRLIEATSAADNNVKVEERPGILPSDPMTLRQIKDELGLTEKQIVTLRQLWGFPAPFNAPESFVFSRVDIDLWAKRQPNSDNLAAVLRLRRRDKWLIDRQKERPLIDGLSQQGRVKRTAG